MQVFYVRFFPKKIFWMETIYAYQGVSEVQFWITEGPKLFEFEVASCRLCRLRSKLAILEVATSNLQKWRGIAQSWGPCMFLFHVEIKKNVTKTVRWTVLVLVPQIEPHPTSWQYPLINYLVFALYSMSWSFCIENR